VLVFSLCKGAKTFQCQRRFWAHLITDQGDFNQLVEYPPEFGCVKRVMDWPHPRFHQFVGQGIYPASWEYSGEFIIYATE
jgi:putative transposase